MVLTVPEYCTPLKVANQLVPDGSPNSVKVSWKRKEAVSVIGPFIVIVAGLDVPEYDPAPLPVQLPNEYPELGVAVIVTEVPELTHSDDGETDPPAPALVVR